MINGYMKLLVPAALAMVFSGCQRTPADTSFGVEGTTLDCADDSCDVIFAVNNQLPHAMDIRYRAVLSNAREDVILELSERIKLPALEKTWVSKTVSVSDRPSRLRVTVTTLQGL